MDSYELNKLIGGLLAVVFVVFSVSILSESIFSSPVPETAGYAIVAVEPEAGEGGGDEAAAPVAIATLLATADADAGAAVFKKCAACHTPNQGGGNKVGPNLWEIVNRPVAAIEGFGYSAAMREFAKGGAELWTFDHLNGFLLAPKSYIKGTAMGFAGLKKDDERANVIAYLRTLSASPAPLPEAPAPAAENASAPAGDAPVDQAPPAQSLEEGAPAQAAPGAQTPGDETDVDTPNAPGNEAAAPAAEAPAGAAAPATETPAAATPAAPEAPAEAPASPNPAPAPAP